MWPKHETGVFSESLGISLDQGFSTLDQKPPI